ncbi:hypothetical protein PM10SUCC1_38280 [Propionigenium maris DSM 9537]|uniref:DUF2357 domain-containing protein n=1 Tax=Propionigenium maris DSM 9537 TaxID=1123000 RepID=A0A9W6GNJ2_9FUSO|nr:hypothetical protein [Propionigenium maris]GLI58314.1 hypothetical protein PM10SUCC1_38280 [Propionigenium maris DSM 9537]
MDTQAKIYIKNNKINKEILLNTLSEGEEVFSISEYGDACLTFETPFSDSYILVETFDKEEGTIVRGGEEVFINRHLINDGSVTSLVPAKYILKYYFNGKFYDYNFSVTSDSLEFEHLKVIKDSLEDLLPNITKNLLSSKRLNSSCEEGYSSEFELYHYLSEHYNELVFNLNAIKKNPLNELIKQHQKCRFSKNPDYKTHRFYQKKGITGFETKDGEYIHLEKKINYTLDIPENKWLFQALDKLNNIFSKHISKLNNEILYLKKSNESHNKEIKSKKSEYDRISKKYQVSKQSLNNLQNKIKYLESEMNKNSKLIKKLEPYKEKIFLQNQIITSFLYSEFFNEVSNKRSPIKNPIKIIKNKKYGWLYNFIESIGQFKENSSKNFNFFNSKPTWLLFEYFSVILFIQALLDLGFKWESGWISSNKEDFSLKGLESETEIIFTKDNIKAILFYDKEIEEIKEMDKEGFDSSLSKNRRPDILIGFFDHENNLINSVISEVKCCRGNNIYQNSYSTKNFEQMKNYLNICYKPLNQRIKRSVVSKVLVPYPLQKQTIKRNNCPFEEDIKFIPIKASSQINESIGFTIIKDNLEELISDYL